MCLKHGDGFPALNDERFVIGQTAQLGDDRVERFPVPRRFSGSTVHHEIFGALGHVGIEIVHQHPEGGFLLPPATADLAAAWSAHDTAGLRRRDFFRIRSSTQYVRHEVTSPANLPRATASASSSMSGVSTRSASSGLTIERTVACAGLTPRPGLSGAR